MWPFAHLLEAWVVARTRFPSGADAGHDPEQLATAALAVAITQLGLAEDGHNGGPNVAKWIAPAQCPQNYCAGFAGWCYQEAARQLGVALPFQRSLGAKRLGANVAAVGRRFTDPTEAKPGDLMIFDRGAQGSWMGHVAIVEDAARGYKISGVPAVATVEGNAGPKVKRGMRAAGPPERFAFFASLRRAP